MKLYSTHKTKKSAKQMAQLLKTKTTLKTTGHKITKKKTQYNLWLK